jgi:hypothetical protein
MCSRLFLCAWGRLSFYSNQKIYQIFDGMVCFTFLCGWLCYRAADKLKFIHQKSLNMKRLKNTLQTLFCALGVAFLLSNCASLTGFQDGRSLGSGTELSASLNLNSSPDFNDLEDRDTSGTITDIPNLFLPNLEFAGRFAVAPKVDIMARFNTNLNVGVGAKVQVVGDQESKVALALGAEVATFGLVSGIWNVQVPVYFSLHPSEKLTWYASPRFVYQFVAWAGADGGARYLGANTGLLFGKRHKFGLDFGYYSFGTSETSTPLIQFGLGGRFRI